MSDTIVRVLPYSVDLSKPIKKTYLDTLFATEDNQAHRFDITLLRNGAALSMPSGTSVIAYLIRYSDNDTVLLTGSVSGSMVSVTLSKACYTKAGQFALIIKATTGSTVSTVFYGEGAIYTSRTDTIVDQEHIIPSLPDLLAQLDAMEAATSAVNTAIGNANTAANNSNEAAGKANTAAENANESAGNANTATEAANDAAGKINNMTVAATPLETGTATAELTTVAGHYHLALGLPKGDTGATPQISVQVQTGEAGSDASVSVSGTAEEPVILLTIPRGDVGDIGALTINGKTPDGSGAVTLTPDDLGAATAEEVSRLKDDKLDKTATAADSSKLGGKAPEYYLQPRNLLDNSYWAQPKEIVNQRGFVSGSLMPEWSEFIDRWKEYNGNAQSTFTFDTSGSLVNGKVVQKISNDKVFSGKPYTYAVYFMDDTVICASGIVTTGQEGWNTFAFHEEGNVQIVIFSDSDESIGVRFMDTGSKHIKGHALIPGSYTADTLPPYVPKGYVSELAECQQRFHVYATANARPSEALDCCPPMILAPGQTVITQGTMTVDGKTLYYNSTDL